MIDKNKILSKMPIEVSDTSYVLDYGSWLYTEEVRLEYNLENAKRILTEAGYKNKNGKWYDKNNKQLMLNILVNNNNENHKIFINQLKEEMELNGFLINIILQNRETYLQNILNKNYDIAIISYTNPIEPNLEMFFGENNFSQYRNEEIINLLNEIKNIDDIQMINKYKKISEIYVKDLPFLPLFRNTKALITSTGLVSELRPNSQNVFQNIEKWYRR